MSVRMLSRPSSSSGSAPKSAGGGGAGGAAPTSPPKSPQIFVSPSPSRSAAPSPPVLDAGFFGTEPFQFPRTEVEDPTPKIVLPPPWEEEDLTDPLTKQVVVIGVISRLEDEASQLLDRILLMQMFSNIKCANPRSDQGTTNPNLSSDDVVNNETEKVLPQENGTGRGKGHGKGRGNQNAGSKATDAQSTRSTGSFDKKVGSGREREWIDGKLKNFYDREKGVLYVQYVWGSTPHDCELRAGENLADALERHEADSLRGLLFMFSVCHILLIVQEGSRFDPRCLRMFRTLQTAKHALAPFVKTQVLPNVVPQLAGRSSPTPRAGAASRDTVGRSGVGVSAGRQSASNGYIGGPAPVLYPGQCTPVALFVCLEELPESAPGVNILGLASEDIGEAAGLSNIYGGLESPGSTSSKPSKSNPGSSKPGIKTEGGVRKKMQASIEAQIRFLLKKCRTLASVVGEGGSSGSAAAALRGITGGVNAFGGAGSGGALFALDQSRAAVFVDRAHNRPGAGLEEISDMIVNFLKDPAPETPETLDLAGLTESVPEDIQAIKDFLLRHTETLRGRGAIASTATGLPFIPSLHPRGVSLYKVVDTNFITGNSSDLRKARTNIVSQMCIIGSLACDDKRAARLQICSSGGAGMVAAAAAAAAASASGGASGPTKPLHNPPDLPTITAWFSASQLLADALTSAWENRDTVKPEAVTAEKTDNLKSQESSPRKAVRRYSQMSLSSNSTGGTLNSSNVVRQRVASLDGVVSNLESAVDIDNKFSKMWCKRSLPAALDVYLNDLPSTYPTIVHNAHLQKALAVFHSMVRGPAVPSFVAKLTANCESIWRAGRQLCDAVSLTGKPCKHLVHGVANEASDSLMEVSDTAVETQTRVQKKHIKGGAVGKPHSSGVMFLHACACGRSRKLRKDPFDYESANVTFFQFPNCEDLLPSLALPASSSDKYLGGSSWSLVRLGGSRYYQPGSGLMQIGFIPEQKHLSVWDIVVLYESIPAAGADIMPETHYGALKPNHAYYTIPNSPTGLVEPKQGAQAEQTFYSKVAEKGPAGENNRVAGRRLDKSPMNMSSSSNINYGGDSAFPPLPQKTKTPTPSKASKPSTANGNEETRRNDPSKNTSVAHGVASPKIDVDNGDKEAANDDSGKTQRFQVYVGFEHECPHGHRFLLSANYVQSLGLSYPQSSPEPNGATNRDSRISEMNEHSDGTVIDKKTREGPEVRRIIKGSGEGHMLLGMDLPIYMQCPHCEASAGREEKQEDMVYAGCVSQLQRIVMVTPSIPLILTTQAVVQFEEDHSSGTPKQQEHSEEAEKQEGSNKPGASEVVLPPDSFLVLRLPFVYQTVEKNGNVRPLSYHKDAPERSAWLVKGTALRVHAKGAGAVETVAWQ